MKVDDFFKDYSTNSTDSKPLKTKKTRFKRTGKEIRAGLSIAEAKKSRAEIQNSIANLAKCQNIISK